MFGMQEEIRRLAAQMLPSLMADRFKHAHGDWTEDQFVKWSVELANKLYVQSVAYSEPEE